MGKPSPSRRQRPGKGWILHLDPGPEKSQKQSRTREIVDEMERLEALLRKAGKGKSEPSSNLVVKGGNANARRLTRLEQRKLNQEKMKHLMVSGVLLVVLVMLAAWLAQLLKV